MNTTLNNSLTGVFSNQITVVADHICAVGIILNIIFGLPTNVYVLWLITKGGKDSFVSDLFALNLSVIEVIYICTSLFVYISLESVSKTFLHFMESAFCFIFAARSLFQCCICVERYLAVVHPVVFMKYKLLRYKLACSGFTWLMTASFCLFYTFLTFASDCKISFYFSISLFLLMFAVKFSCCLAILRALKCPGPGEGDREREGTNNIKMRAFKIMTLMLFSIVFNYLPTILLGIFAYVIDQVYIVLAISFCLSINVVSGFVQPLLHLHRSGKLSCISLYV